MQGNQGRFEVILYIYEEDQDRNEWVEKIKPVWFCLWENPEAGWWTASFVACCKIYRMLKIGNVFLIKNI